MDDPLLCGWRQVDLNAHLLLGLSEKEQRELRSQRWRALQGRKDAVMTYFPAHNHHVEFIFRDELSKSNQDEFPGVFGLESFSEGIKNIREDYTNVINRYGSKPKSRHFYTKEGFLKALRTGSLPPGMHFLDDTGRYVDKYGVLRNNDGPFWPVESVPLFPTPRFKWWRHLQHELLYIHLPGESSASLWGPRLACLAHCCVLSVLVSSLSGWCSCRSGQERVRVVPVRLVLVSSMPG